jgi:hypothetical protein
VVTPVMPPPITAMDVAIDFMNQYSKQVRDVTRTKSTRAHHAWRTPPLFGT